jgi:hypothetical protein
MHDASLFGPVVPCLLILAIGLPPTPATAAGGLSQWSRVTSLKRDTHLIVAVAGRPGPTGPAGSEEKVLEGWLVWADASGLVLQHVEGDWTQSGTSTRSGDVEITRERVAEVTAVKERRPWWAVPLVVAAVAGGIVLCIGALEVLTDGSTWPEGDDTNWGPLAVFAAPFVMGGWAYSKTDRPVRSEKVIYRAPRPAGQAGQ